MIGFVLCLFFAAVNAAFLYSGDGGPLNLFALIFCAGCAVANLVLAVA